MNLRLASHSPEPISNRGRLGKFLNVQYSTQCLIILKVVNLIEVKTAFVLHQDEGFDEFRGLNSEGQCPRLLRLGQVLVDSFRQVQGVRYPLIIH